MSDRSALRLYVYAMPEEDRAAVQLGIDDNCLEPYDDSSSGIVLGMRYQIEEVPVGSAHDLAVHLLVKAPGRRSSCGRTPCSSTPATTPLRGASSRHGLLRGAVRLSRLTSREAHRGTRHCDHGPGQRFRPPWGRVHAPWAVLRRPATRPGPTAPLTCAVA